MVKCEICGKEFKTTQGLRGHKTFAHGIGKTGEVMAGGVFTLKDRIEQLESKVSKLGEVEGIKELKEEISKLGNTISEVKSEFEGKISAHLSSIVALGVDRDNLRKEIKELKEKVDKIKELKEKVDKYHPEEEEPKFELI